MIYIQFALRFLVSYKPNYSWTRQVDALQKETWLILEQTPKRLPNTQKQVQFSYL